MVANKFSFTHQPARSLLLTCPTHASASLELLVLHATGIFLGVTTALLVGSDTEMVTPQDADSFKALLGLCHPIPPKNEQSGSRLGKTNKPHSRPSDHHELRRMSHADNSQHVLERRRLKITRVPT